MTDILQVMELVVNGPLKAAIRRDRSLNQFKYVQGWKIKRLTALASKPKPPRFKPMAPKLVDGMKALYTCLNTTLRSEASQAFIKQCFVKV